MTTYSLVERVEADVRKQKLDLKALKTVTGGNLGLGNTGLGLNLGGLGASLGKSR